MSITLIGFGIAGQLLLSYILDLVTGYNVTIIDPDFLGGDLIRDYANIYTNTTIAQKIKSLEKLPNTWSESINSLRDRGELNDTVLLADLITDLRKSSGKLVSQCKCIYDKVKKVSWNEESRVWKLYLDSGSTHTTRIICFCGGMVPRQDDYGIPIIPLSIAMDESRLSRIIKKTHHIIVIGSAHSATLVLKNLNNIPGVLVSCLYRGSKPFKYARDNEYSGIKKESADIADAIEKGTYTNISFIPINNIPVISKTIRNADWIIQANGFTARFPDIFIGDTCITPTWNPQTGLSNELPQAQAFGACVPSVTCINNDIYPDISLSSFVDQLEQRWPLLKSTIQNQNLV
jgi:hypothetical protein